MKIYSIPLILCFIISISSVSSQSEGSCVGKCGQGYVRADPCHCDYNCMTFMECCQDYKKVCTTEGSCKGRCHEGFIRGQTCDCDPGCIEIGKCCPDHKNYCVKPEKDLQPPPSPPDQPVRDEKDKPPEPTKKPDKVAEDVPEDPNQKSSSPKDKKRPSKKSSKIPKKKKKVVESEEEIEESEENVASSSFSSSSSSSSVKGSKITKKLSRKNQKKNPTPKDKDKPKNPKTPKTKDGNDEPESHPEEPKEKPSSPTGGKDGNPNEPRTREEPKEKPSSPTGGKDGNPNEPRTREEPTSDGKDRIPRKPKEPGDDTKEPDVPPKDPTSDDNRGNPKKPTGTGDDPVDTDVSPKEPNQGDPDNDDKPRKTKTPKENESNDPEDTGNPPNEPNHKEKKKPKKTISLETEENIEEHTDVNSANTDENVSQSKQRTTRKRSPTNSKKKPKRPGDDTDDPSQNPSPSDKGKKKPNSKRPNKKKGKPTDGDDPSENPSPSDKGEKNPVSKEPNKKKGKPTDEDGDEPSKLGKGKNPKKKPNQKVNTKIKKKINSEDERQETVESEFSSSSQSSTSHTRSKSTRRLTGKNKKKPKDKKKIPDKPEDPLMPPKPKKDKGSPPTPVPTFKDEGSGDDGSGMDFLSTTTPRTTLMVHSTTTASLTTRETNQTERTVNPSKSPTKNPDVTSDNGISTTPNILPTKAEPEKNTNLMNASTQSPTAEDTTTGKGMTTDTPLQQSKNLKYTTAMNDLEASVIVTHIVVGKVNDVTTVSSQDDGSTVKHLEIDTVGKDITSSVTPPSLLEMAATKTTEGKKGMESTLNPGITQLKTDSVSNNETTEEANKETSPYPISRHNTAESPARTSIVVESTGNAVSEKGNAKDGKTTMEDKRAFAQTTPSGVNKLLIWPEVTRTPVQNVTLQKMQSTEENPSPSVGPGSTNIFNMATKPTDAEYILSTTVLDEVHKTEHFHTLAEAQNIPQGLTEGLHDLSPATSDATEYASNQLLVSASASHMTPSNDESSPAHSRVTTDIPSESSTWTRLKDSIIPTEINANNILSLSITTEPSPGPKTETNKNTHREEKISTPDTLDNVETIPSEPPTFIEAQNVNEKKNTSESIDEVLPDTTSANINLNTAQSTANTRITESESLSKTTAENMSNNSFTAESSERSESMTEEMHLPTGRELYSTSETLREDQTLVDETSMQTKSTQSTAQTIGREITDIITTMGPTEGKTSSDMAITENTMQSRLVGDSTTEKTIAVSYTAIGTASAEAEKSTVMLHSTLLPMELSTREAPMEVSSDENIQGTNTHPPTTTLSKDVTVSDVRPTGTTLEIVETIQTEPPTFTEAQNVDEKQSTSQSVGEILPDTIRPMATTDTAPSTANTRITESESLSKTTAENMSDNAFTAESSEKSESATEVTHLPTERGVHSASETLKEEQTSVDTTTIKTTLTQRTGQTVGTEITKGTVTDIITTMGPTESKTSSVMAITENTIQSKSMGDSTTEKTIPISYTVIVTTSAEAEKSTVMLHSTLLPMELSTREAPMEVSSDENIQGTYTHPPTTTLTKDVTVSDVRPTGTTLEIEETIPTEQPTFTEAQNVHEKQSTSQSVGEILPDAIRPTATTDTAPSTANTRITESESLSKTTAENMSDNAFTAENSEQSDSATQVTHLPTEREVHSASETLKEEQTSVDTTTIKTTLTQRTGQTVGTEITKGTVTDIITTMGATEGKTSSVMAITVNMATESKSLTEDITNHTVTLATDMTKVIESMERTGTETLLTPSVPDILKNSLSTTEVPDGDEVIMTTYSSKITTKSQTADIANKIHSPTSLSNVDSVTEKTTAISYTAIVTSSAEVEKSTAQLHSTLIPMEFSTHETPREETDENIQGRSTHFPNLTMSKDTTVSPDVRPTDTIHKATDILAGTPLTDRANTEKFLAQSITPLPTSVEVRERTKSTEAHPSPTKTAEVLSEATEFPVKGTDEKPATYMLSTVVEGLLSMVEATDSFSMERTHLTQTSKDNIIISSTAQALQTTDITKQRNTGDIELTVPPSKITTIDLSTTAENTEIGKGTTSSESSHHLSSSEQTFPFTEATTNTKNIYGMTVTSDAEVSVSEIKTTNGGQTERMYETSQTPKDVTMEKESLAGTTMQSPFLSVTTEHHNGGSTYPTSLPNDSKTDPLLMSSTVEGESNNPTVSLTSDIDYTSKDPKETGHEKQTISAQTIKDSTTITLMGITDILSNLATSDKPTPSDVPEYQKPDVSPTNSLLKKEIEESLEETFASVMPGDGITSSVTAPLTFSQKDKSIEITLLNDLEQPTVTQVVQFIEANSTKLPSSHEITHIESITNRDDTIVTGNVGLSEIPTITDPNRNNALHQTTHQALVKNTQETVDFTSVKTSVHYTRPTEDPLTTTDNMKIITVTTLVPKETDTKGISSSSPFFAKTTQIQTDTSAHEVTGTVHTTQWPQTEVSTEQSERTSFSTNVRDRPLSGVTMTSRMTTEATSTTLSIVTSEEPKLIHVGTNTVAEGTEELPLSKEQMSTITEVPILPSTQDSQETSPISRISLSGTSHHPYISKEDTIKPELVTGDTNAEQLDTSISTIVAKEHIATTEDANVLTTVLDKDSSADQSNFVTRNAEGIFIMTTEKNKSLTTELSSQGDAATYSTSSTVELTKSTLATTNKDTPTSTSFKLLDKYYTTGGTADSSRAKTLSIMDITRAQGSQTGKANTENERVTSEPIESFSPTRKDHLLSTLLDIDTSRIRNTYGLTPLHSSVSPKYSSLPDITSRKHGLEGISTSRQGLGGSIDQNVPINAVSSSVIEAKVTNSKHTSKIFASTSYMNLHDPSFNFTVSTLKTLQDQSTTDSSDITHITVSGKLQETTNTLSFNSETVDPTKHTLPITYNGKYITSKQATGTWHSANAPSEFTDNPLDQSTGYFMAHTNIMPFSTTATTQKSEQAQTKETIAYSDITVITESTTRHSDHTTKTTTKEPSTEPQQKPTTELLATLTTEIPEDDSEISTIISTSKDRPTPTKSMIFQTTTLPTDKDDTEMSTMSMRPTKRPYPRGLPTNRPIEPEEMEHTKTTKPSTTNQYHVCDLLKDEAIKLRISDDDLQRITEICTEMQQQHPFVSTPSPDLKQPYTGDRNIPFTYPHVITPNWNQQPGTRIIQIVEEIYRRMNSSPMTNITVVHGYTVHKPSKWLLLVNKIKSSNDPQKNLCIGQPADGMTTLQNGSMVVFRGHHFWTLNQGGVMGCPRKITEVWGIPSPIDTVFTRCNCGGKTFFFKGSRYWRFTNDAMDQGYPKEIIKGFGGLRGKVTAVLPSAGFRTRPESVYFFKPGGTVQRYTFRQEQAKRCTKKKRPSIQYPIYSQTIQTIKYRFPRNVVRHRIQIHRTFSTVQQPLGVLHEQTSISSTWRGIPNNIISAVSLPNYKKQDGFDYYVFSKDKYYNINMSSKTAVKPPPGSEQQTSKDWYKCKE